MDQEPDMRTKGPDEIRHEIDETRVSLTEKLETLEDQVRGTVQGARDSVEETIANVRGTVRDTVESVKRTFDVTYQTERHPWAMIGGSLLAGFVIGSLLPPPRREERRHSEPEPWPEPRSAYRPEYVTDDAARDNGPGSNEIETEAPARPTLLDNLADQFHDEINQVKQMAIGAAVGLARDYVKQAAPPAWAPQVSEIFDNVTAKLGGKPVQGNVAESFGIHSK